MSYAILLILSYFLGAIPFGLIIGKAWRGIDIRDHGSGNIGATNVFRTLGPGPGTVVFTADVLKGLLPVIAARHISPGVAWLAVASGMVAILGHTLSVFLKFKGGKGVATSLGVAIGLAPVIAAIAFGFWVVIFAITRYVSVASMLASLSVPVMMWATDCPIEYRVFGMLVAAYVIVKHRSNIVRLMQGKENRFGRKAAPEG
jgi:glycerol-3-phosphate acyltransferase PlsY